MNYTLPTLKTKDPDDWYVYYTYLDTETGRMVPFKHREGINRIKVKKDRIERGKEIVHDVTAKLKTGWCPLPSKVKLPYEGLSLLEAFDKLYKVKEKSSLEKTTLKAYEYGIDNLKEFLKIRNMSNIMPTDFKGALANSFSDWMYTEKNFTTKTHNNQLLYLGVFFNMLSANETITKNPLLAIKRKSPGDSDYHTPYTVQERSDIKSYLQENNPKLLPLVQFIYYCGLRPREISKIQVKHIDWINNRIQTAGRVSKNKKRNSVQIPMAFIDEVKKRYATKDPENYLFGRGLECNNIKVHPNRYSEAHREVLKALNIDNSHTLYAHKHSGAIAFINAGGSPYALMLQYRHSSFDETMIYLRKLGLQPNVEFSEKQPQF